MSDQVISAFNANRLLDYEFSAVVYVSLHTADPGETGANEVTGGSYARQAVAAADWSTAASKSLHNINPIDFTGMPAATSTHFGLWDADGFYLRGGPLDSSLVTTSGDTARIPATDLEISLINRLTAWT